jgi:hypothetical protein
MTWEQRFGALIELDGDEWDAAHKRLEQEWLAAYTAAFCEIAVSRGRRENAETGRSGLAMRHSSKPTATTGTHGARLRKTLSHAKSHPDCPIRARLTLAALALPRNGGANGGAREPGSCHRNLCAVHHVVGNPRAGHPLVVQ